MNARGGDDDDLLRALRNRDERVFSDLVDRCSGIMLRLALAHVANRAIAEEVVQDAWLTMLRSLDDPPSAPGSWASSSISHARSCRAAFDPAALRTGRPVLDPARFLPANHARWPHHWAVEPARWPTTEEDVKCSCCATSRD